MIFLLLAIPFSERLAIARGLAPKSGSSQILIQTSGTISQEDKQILQTKINPVDGNFRYDANESENKKVVEILYRSCVPESHWIFTELISPRLLTQTWYDAILRNIEVAITVAENTNTIQNYRIPAWQKCFLAFWKMKQGTTWTYNRQDGLVVDARGDGNCAFHALISQNPEILLMLGFSKKEMMDYVREPAAIAEVLILEARSRIGNKFIEISDEIALNEYVQDADKNQSRANKIQIICDEIIRPGNWLNNSYFQLLAKILKRHILLRTLGWGEDTDLGEAGFAYIFMINNNHFQEWYPLTYLD